MKLPTAIAIALLTCAPQLHAQTENNEAQRLKAEQDKQRALEDAAARAQAEAPKQKKDSGFIPPVLRWEDPPRGQDWVGHAIELESAGEGPAAVKVYERAARAGSGKAALRLCQIYDKGIPGVARDYPESLRWCNFARYLGEDVAMPKRP